MSSDRSYLANTEATLRELVLRISSYSGDPRTATHAPQLFVGGLPLTSPLHFHYQKEALFLEAYGVVLLMPKPCLIVPYHQTRYLSSIGNILYEKVGLNRCLGLEMVDLRLPPLLVRECKEPSVVANVAPRYAL